MLFNKTKKKNKNLLKRIQQEKLAVKQEQILYEKQKSKFIKQTIKTHKELLNKSRTTELKLSLFNQLAFTKEEDNDLKSLYRRKQSEKTRNNYNNASTNNRRYRLDKLLVETEKVTKNLYLEEHRTKELEDRLKEWFN